MVPDDKPQKSTELINGLADRNPAVRLRCGCVLFDAGVELTREVISAWQRDADLASLFVHSSGQAGQQNAGARATVGIAVLPENFTRIREANGLPSLADVPPDQDASEFELHFGLAIRLDILTTKQPCGEGAIAKFLAKFGEGVQQVEYDVTDVDRAAEILAARFGQKAIYPATRRGADGTRVNFFLVLTNPADTQSKKILIELVQAPR
jgi:hypothetical protein